MQVEIYNRSTRFLSRAGHMLVSNEARYGLINGIARKLVDNPHAYGKDDPWFCVAIDNNQICAVAIRTPPFKVLLAHFSGDPIVIAKVLVDSISKFSQAIPGVTGDLDIADSFTQHWFVKHYILVSHKIAQRIYQLNKVNTITAVPGHLRVASQKENELLIKWSHSFHRDVYAAGRSNTPENDITPAIERKDVYLWEDGVPVSMAAKTRPIENGIAISGVYTPPEFRRRGYATSCVANVCTRLLVSGYKFCVLYTDLANPISNSIYKKIGFREVCDLVEYSFTESLSKNTQ